MPVRIRTDQVGDVELFRRKKNSINSGTSAALLAGFMHRTSFETLNNRIFECAVYFKLDGLNFAKNVDLYIYNWSADVGCCD